jgi:hypothetical protein
VEVNGQLYIQDTFPARKNPRIPLSRKLVGPTAGLDFFGEKKNFPLLGFELRDGPVHSLATSVNHWWNDTDMGKPKYLEKNLCQCHFVKTKMTPNCT